MDRIIEAASDLASRYGTTDLDEMARELGVAVYDLLEAEHLKEAYFPELKAIALRPSLPDYERRFLLAHGLAHHLFHTSGGCTDFIRMHAETTEAQPTTNRGAIARLEAEADLFAAYLLIPESRLAPLLQDGWVCRSEDPALQLALEFRVPVDAMRIRLVYERCRRLPEER